MKKQTLVAAAVIALPSAAIGQIGTEPPPPPPVEAPGPADIVNAAPQDDWVVIAPEDMVVMTLAPDRDGNAREVVIQLMPAPFSQGWVENIRTLARAKWYDGISVNRVQDNYVVQWGDPGHDNPEGEGIETKPLPEGLKVMGENKYFHSIGKFTVLAKTGQPHQIHDADGNHFGTVSWSLRDEYVNMTAFRRGWPFGIQVTGAPMTQHGLAAPVHCYGMVGVGRNYSPDTGSGAELYTVIGHAPRHLDRNIALVGRIIGGMEHLSSLPRGSGALGFYTSEEADKRTPILSIRVASDLPEEERPLYEFLNTETQTFAAYAEARANRRDPFFIVPAGGADICNIPVPVRKFEFND